MASKLVLRGILTALVVLVGVLTQLEVDSDMLLAHKRVALAKSRAKLFQYVADMRNMAAVCITTFTICRIENLMFRLTFKSGFIQLLYLLLLV